jgi:hypothetical protein
MGGMREGADWTDGLLKLRVVREDSVYLLWIDIEAITDQGLIVVIVEGGVKGELHRKQKRKAENDKMP